MEVISTAGLPAGERFAFWREVSSSLWVPYELRCEPELEPRFQARVGVSGFGAVQATLVTTSPHGVRRTGELIRQADPEVFELGRFINGSGFIEQNGRQDEFHPGDLMLFDTSRPFRGRLSPDRTASRLLLLQFPRSLLPLPRQQVRRLSGVRLRGDQGVGALSSRFLLELARRMDEFSPAETVRLSTLTLDVLSTALAGALDARNTVPAETRRRALLAQVHAFIRDHLADPRLDPRMVAAAHNISLRYLHKLFHAEEKTVAGWIRTSRLKQCRRDLLDPRLAAEPIGAIAARWGFTSAAHFSQAFRTAYGVSPRQLRTAVTAG